MSGKHTYKIWATLLCLRRKRTIVEEDLTLSQHPQQQHSHFPCSHSPLAIYFLSWLWWFTFVSGTATCGLVCYICLANNSYTLQHLNLNYCQNSFVQPTIPNPKTHYLPSLKERGAKKNNKPPTLKTQNQQLHLSNSWVFNSFWSNNPLNESLQFYFGPLLSPACTHTNWRSELMPW